MLIRAVVGLLSGCVWGAIAYLIGRAQVGPAIWGGVFASPLIGLLVAVTIGRLDPPARSTRVVLSLVTLYAAACLFGLAVGVHDLLRFAQSGPGWQRVAVETVFGSVWGVLWGLTLTGYVVVLWPLAYVNHRWMWRLP